MMNYYIVDRIIINTAHHITNMIFWLNRLFNVLKGEEGKGRNTYYSASYMSAWTEVLYNLGSGSWLAWANDIPQHTIAAIHCPHRRTIGPAVCR